MAARKTTTAKARITGAEAPDEDASITVLISPVIEREFRRRDVFPELQLENATRVRNGATGVHKVSTERAKELLTDAQAVQAHSRELPRGIPAAYSALVRNLGFSLKQEAKRGLWDDPGMDEVKMRVAASSACFEVGDTVLCFVEDDEYGEAATIVSDYKMYSVISDNGPYLANDGCVFQPIVDGISGWSWTAFQRDRGRCFSLIVDAASAVSWTMGVARK
jgi:hypothetical protein